MSMKLYGNDMEIVWKKLKVMYKLFMIVLGY